MQVAVAGVEHVADAEPRGGDDLVHPAEHVRKLRARDDAVHHHVGRRHAAVRAERGLAALPEELPLGLAPRRAHLARARLAARLDDVLGLNVHPDGEPVQLDEQRRVGVARVAAVEGVLDRLDRQVVDHLHRRRHQPARDDRRHGGRRLVDRVEYREHGLDGLRLLEDADDDPRGDPERALGADEDAGQVVAARLPRLAAEPHDLAVGHDHFEAQHVIRGDAVLQGVRAARVVGDVAADRARLLARGIGRVVVAARADLPREVQVDEPGLDDGQLVLVVDLEHPVHPHHRDHDAALGRQAPAREPGARAAGDERKVLAVRELHDRRDVLGRRRKDDEVGERAEQGQPVGFVHHQLVGVREHGALADDRLELAPEIAFSGIGQGRHGTERIILRPAEPAPPAQWRAHRSRSADTDRRAPRTDRSRPRRAPAAALRAQPR